MKKTSNALFNHYVEKRIKKLRSENEKIVV